MVINDQFNVRTLYPSKPGGERRYVTQTGSNINPYNYTIITNDDSEVGRSFTFGAPVVQAVFTTNAGYRQGSIILDHSRLDLNTGGRGYMMDAKDWRDVEMTAYIRVASAEDNEISLSVRGGQHDPSRPCEYSSYKVALHYTTGNFRIRKERYLGGFANAAPLTTTAGPLDHWVGVKLVTVNRIIGGKHCVLIEVWIDANNSNSWIKRGSLLDDGNDLCATGTSCGGAGNCQIISWGGPMATYEIRSTGVSIAKCSIREISYDGSFGSTPPPPPSTGQPPTPPPPVEGENPSGKFIIQPGNITASGNDGNVPANTYDSNLDTRWSSNPIPQWITYDLGAVRRISSVGIHWYRPVIPDPPPPPPPTPPPGSPPPSPPSPPGSLIEGGVRMFYPKKATGKDFYFSSSNPGRWQMISELDHCFVNLEVTGYLFIHDPPDDMQEEVSIKVRGSCHGCNSDNCGRCYIIGVQYDGTVNAQYEQPHPDNHEYGIHGKGGNFNPGSSMIGRWFGIKAICFLQGDHDHLECWLDTSGLNSSGQPINNWRKFWELNVDEYTGRCNSSGCEKGDLVFYRADELNGNEEDAVDSRFLTAREIIP